MNRADFRWQLDAVLPHVGRTEQTNVVGLTRNNQLQLMAWATDRYTLGIASVEDGPDVDVRLSGAEARELLRFVRPSTKTTERQEVTMLVDGLELHVGFLDDDGNVLDSAVYALLEHSTSVEDLWRVVDHLDQECEDEYQPQPFQPALFSRFAKAANGDENCRMLLHPKRFGDQFGAALIYLPNFVGAVAALTYEERNAA